MFGTRVFVKHDPTTVISLLATVNVVRAAMDDVVSKTATVTKVPLPVEESRAQRLQRQQARFRDRGGYVH